MRCIKLLCWLLAGSSMMVSAHASVTAFVFDQSVAAGETFKLTLEHVGPSSTQPDLVPLDQDFDVLAISNSNQQMANAAYMEVTRLTIRLLPKRSGRLTIPALSWGSERSTPLQITVSGILRFGTGLRDDSDVFFKTTVDPAQPYVKSAVDVTVRLYVGVPLHNPVLDLPMSSDVLVRRVGKDRISNEDINGRHYEVIERHYLLFPQRSGALELSGPVLGAQVWTRDRKDSPGRFYGRSRFANAKTLKTVRVRAEDYALEVRPRPARASATYWIPAKDLEITSVLNPDNLTVHAGEPLTLHVRITAQGLAAVQLPDIAPLLEFAGLRAYPDRPKLANSIRNGTIVGSRDQSIALIASQPGTFTLPAVHVQWWDTTADQLRDAVLPARRLQVLAAGNGVPGGAAPRDPLVSNAAPMPRSSQPGAWPWHWVSVALAVLWIGTLIAWWSTASRAAVKQPNASQARRRFAAACRLDDAAAARRALLDWARARWPDTPIPGLQALGVRLTDSNVQALVLQLDRACFTGGEWHGRALAHALDRLPTAPYAPKAPRAELPELYP